jgi:hypothetical protein
MKTKDGLRIYGTWAGNPAGHKEDVSLCIESVCEPGRGGMIHQCYRKRGHGEGGLYCKQHDPVAVAAKAAERTRKYNERWDKIANKQAREGRYRAALEEMLKILETAHDGGCVLPLRRIAKTALDAS